MGTKWCNVDTGFGLVLMWSCLHSLTLWYMYFHQFFPHEIIPLLDNGQVIWWSGSMLRDYYKLGAFFLSPSKIYQYSAYLLVIQVTEYMCWPFSLTVQTYKWTFSHCSPNMCLFDQLEPMFTINETISPIHTQLVVLILEDLSKNINTPSKNGLGGR